MSFKKTAGVSVVLGVFASALIVSNARSELVLDKESKKPEVQETARSEERESTRQVIESGRKAEIANETENRGGNVPSGNAYGLGKKDDKDDKDKDDKKDEKEDKGKKEETAIPAVVSPAPVLTPTTSVAEPTPAATPAPETAQSLEPVQVQGEVQNLTRAELMRRQRMRAELSSEDLLHERLEEMRLKEEKNRLDQLMHNQLGQSVVAAPAATSTVTINNNANANNTNTNSSNALSGTEVVVAPVTENPGQPVVTPAPAAPVAAAPVVAAPAAAPVVTQQAVVTPVAPAPAVVAAAPAPVVVAAPAPVAPVAHTEAVVPAAAASASPAVVTEAPVDNGPMGIKLSPEIGYMNFVGANANSLSSRYSLGLSAEVAVSDHLSAEFGYMFTEYGARSAYPYGLAYQYQMMRGGPMSEPFTLKQNLFNVGMKVYFMKPEAKFRPFIGGGGAFARSFLNYDPLILNALAQSGGSALGHDYEINSYLGYLSTGMDLKLTKSISLGLTVKYFNTLSSRSNVDGTLGSGTSSYGPSLYGTSPYGVAPYGLGFPDQDRRALGQSIALDSFYSIQTGVSFSF